MSAVTGRTRRPCSVAPATRHVPAAVLAELRRARRPEGGAVRLWLRRRLWRLEWWATWVDRKLDTRLAEEFADWWRVNGEDEEAER